jgi:Uma2 family endonuclease
MGSLYSDSYGGTMSTTEVTKTKTEPVGRAEREHTGPLTAPARTVKERYVTEEPGRRRRLFTRDEYYRMAEAGVLRADEGVELIEGEIVTMSPQGPRHGGGVTRVERLLHSHLDPVAIVRTQLPVALDEHNEPEPDFAVVVARDDFYSHSHPAVADLRLLVEVMESSVRTDRREKLPLYARHSVPEVWLVDLPRRWVEIYREPMDDEYTERRTASGAEPFSPTAFPDVVFTADAILGPADEQSAADAPATDH